MININHISPNESVIVPFPIVDTTTFDGWEVLDGGRADTTTFAEVILGGHADTRFIDILHGGHAMAFEAIGCIHGGHANTEYEDTIIGSGDELIVGGCAWLDVTGLRLWLHHNATMRTFDIAANDGRVDRWQAAIRLHFPEDMPTGQYQYRLYNDWGVVSDGIFQIGKAAADKRRKVVYGNNKNRIIYE